MQYGYTPYQYGARKPKFSERVKIRVPSSLKKWLLIVAGVLVAMGIGFYSMLGDLRFFADHFFGLTFFSKHYLVLLQNNYELRPTGGFITAYGTVDTFMGRVTKMEFKNSYNIDTVSAENVPETQEAFFKNDRYTGYTFRGSNWEPDFRKSAQEAVRFYELKFPDQKIDGVASVDFSFIEGLLGQLGSVTLNGKTVDSNNLFSELEFEVNNVDRHNVDALGSRKTVLGDLAAQLMGKAKLHPLLMRDAIVQGLKDKEIALWLKDEGLESQLVEKGWANAMDPAENSDFLGVVLANLGAKKADRYVTEEVHSVANLSHDIPEVSVEVTLRYPGLLNAYSDNYRGYIRVYLPQMAQIESSPVDSDLTTEGEFRVVGTKLAFPAGNKVSLNYLYTLPRSTFPNDEYRLRVVKQSGTNALYDLAVQSAEGMQATGTQFKNLENRGVYTGALEGDTDFKVDFKPDGLAPYPVEQDFDDLQHLRVTWDKPIDSTTANDASNYKITDLNVADPKTDTVAVTKADLTDPNVVVLELTGVTTQNEEHYSLEMKGIKDLSGDPLLPNPKTVTVVQRIQPKPAANLNFHLGVVPAPATNPVLP
jgi:Protein of unknown function (DUF4012)